MHYLVQFVTAGVLFAVIDAFWLSIVANKLYRSELGYLLADKPNMVAAVLFYLIFLAGMVAFVIAPALAAGDWRTALGYGALFGFVTYATYDLTNLATVKDFPVKIVIIDMLWGTVLSAVVAFATFFILHR